MNISNLPRTLIVAFLAGTILSSPTVLAGGPNNSESKSIIDKVVQFTSDNFPYLATGAGTIAVATLTYYWFFSNNNVPPGGAAIAGGAALLHGANNIPGNGGLANPQPPRGQGFGGPSVDLGDQLLQRALLESQADEDRRKKMDLESADLRFNEDIFRTLQNLPELRDRIQFLKALLYNHDQLFLGHEEIEDFAAACMQMQLDDMISAFHQLATHSYSLLQLAPHLESINPENPVPLMPFDVMQQTSELQFQMENAVEELSPKELRRRRLERFGRIDKDKEEL